MRSIFAVLFLALVFPLLVIGAGANNDDPLTEGIRLFNQGSYEQAVQPLSKAIVARPDDAVARLTYGVALANDRKYDDAIVQFREVTRLSPNDPIAYFLLEGALQGKGQSAQAQSVRQEADRRLATTTRPQNVLGAPGSTGLEGSRGPAGPPGPVGTMDHGSTVLSAAGTATSLPEKAATEHPESAIAQNLLGDYYQIRGNTRDAIIHYRMATERAPGWVKPWFNLGMANLSDNPAEATANFRKVIELDPNNSQAQLYLGDAYARQNDYPRALKSYNQAANADALRPMANSRAGNVYIKTNQLDKAEAEFKNAAKEAPHDPVPQAGLGDVALKRKNLPESQTRYQQAANLAQTNSNLAQNSIIANQQAEVSIQQGDYQKAVAQLKETMALNPSSSEPVKSLVQVYQKGGMLKDGITEYRGALTRDPHDTSAMLFLLYASTASGDQAGRSEMARKLLKAVPDNSGEWHRELGSALVAQGDKKGALSAWRRGLAIQPVFDDAAILPVVESSGLMKDLIASLRTESATKKAPEPSLILANIYEDQHDYASAAGVRRRLTELYPEAQKYWIWYAQDLVEAGDKGGAREAYTRASEMNDSLTLRALAQQRLKALK